MLTIENIHWKFTTFTQPSELVKVLATRLAKLKIATKMMTVGSNTIVFQPVSGSKIALSNVENRIIMAPGDPRIEKKGRNYLETKRLTKAQYDGFFEVIQNTLDELGVSATVVLQDKTKHVLRNGKEKVAAPVLKSYPIAK